MNISDNVLSADNQQERLRCMNEKDNDGLIRKWGFGVLKRYATDPLGISNDELAEIGGSTGWYKDSVLRLMQSSNLLIEDVRKALQSSEGSHAKEILEAIQDL